jgi:hypothetical protein
VRGCSRTRRRVRPARDPTAALWVGSAAAKAAGADRDSPVTWPVTPYLGTNGRSIDVATGLTYPRKADRARRNPKVSLSFSQPLGSGLAEPATFVIHGLATVRDADLRANSARYLAEVAARLPDAFDSIPTAMLRRMARYWARIWIEGTPVRVLWWPGGMAGQKGSTNVNTTQTPHP